MSTPGFVPQDPNSLATVRYYTPFDPYYFAVDNRPLTDLASNITTISSGGGDSARRAVLLSQLALSSVFQELFSTTNLQGYASGLSVSFPGSAMIQINPGSLYQTTTLNANIGTPIIKQGLLLAEVQFGIVQPSTAGQSINYLIQVQYQDLSTESMPTSPLPFLDATNTFLPCLLLNGQLGIQMKTGAAATTGTQVTPSPDAGWVPLYVITVTNGVASPVISMATNAPDIAGLNKGINPVLLPATSAILTTVTGLSTVTFEKSALEGVNLPLALQSQSSATTNGAFPNPYKPIKLKLVYSSDQAGGNFAMQMKYFASAVGDITDAAGYLTSPIEAVPMNGAIGRVLTYTLATAIIPASTFSGFLSGSWAVTKQKLFAILQRVPTDAADTATGSLFLHDIIAYQ